MPLSFFLLVSCLLDNPTGSSNNMPKCIAGIARVRAVVCGGGGDKGAEFESLLGPLGQTFTVIAKFCVRQDDAMLFLYRPGQKYHPVATTVHSYIWLVGTDHSQTILFVSGGRGA